MTIKETTKRIMVCDFCGRDGFEFGFPLEFTRCAACGRDFCSECFHEDNRTFTSGLGPYCQDCEEELFSILEEFERRKKNDAKRTKKEDK